jgi:Peptidase family C25
MKNTISALVLLLSLLGALPSSATSTSYVVAQSDIYEGYIIERIWLNNYGLPIVTLSNIGYALNVPLPAGVALSDPNKFIVQIGMERKRPFMVVRIPAFVTGADAGIVNQVATFTLSFDEAAKTNNKAAAKTTDVASSVLASGTWYKIGITKTGFYKIDNAFITSMGLNPATINPANIRIFGNGGRMLSEDNGVARPSDLIENAIWVSGNGDNVFDNGEFAAFYGVGTMGWNADTANKRFNHLKNLYTDTSWYFVTFDQGAGLRAGQQSAMASGNVNVSSFNYYDVHEEDLVNPANLGKSWYGEQFYSQLSTLNQNFTFDMGSPVTCVYCKVAFASTSDIAGCRYTVSLNGAAPGASYIFNYGTTGDNVMNISTVGFSGACGAQVANVGIAFSPADLSGVGLLDYIEINARRGLTITGDQLSFRDMASVAAGNVANYQLQNANGSTRVWDVTNPQVPVIMYGTLSGTTYSFTQDAASLHEFAAMNSTNLYTPKFAGAVANQNLHGKPQVDLIIVTYPGFKQQAEDLAAYHQGAPDNMRVVVATTTEVYNEFSSGCQDISAIRDFARMFYKRAGTDTANMPKYLLLFGGASYDYKNRLANNSNFVPVFESFESTNDLLSFSSDDFYSFLDDSENIEDKTVLNVMDIAIGRLPARNQDDATILVNKIKGYASAATLGPWRISTTHVADKGCNDPAGNHMEDAEAAANAIGNSGKNLYNEGKIYVDALPVISTPAGARCPLANAALNEQVFKGTFLINYNGHGNPQVWSAERILTQDDYNNWNNTNMLPFMITATCDFGQFDHPQYVSSAEHLVLRKGGGAIVILTTTQAVYAYYNREINTQYLTSQITNVLGNGRKTFGEASRLGKNITFVKSHDFGEIANFRKFSLLGDPALTPDFPENSIKIDSVLDGYTYQHADTIKALGAYKICGSVRDRNPGNVMTGFNGMLSVTIYDKPRTITTISGCSQTYQVQDNVVYKGRVSVTNGLFSFTFITPKDINYYFGTGKISTYADNGITDAAGP